MNGYNPNIWILRPLALLQLYLHVSGPTKSQWTQMSLGNVIKVNCSGPSKVPFYISSEKRAQIIVWKLLTKEIFLCKNRVLADLKSLEYHRYSVFLLLVVLVELRVIWEGLVVEFTTFDICEIFQKRDFVDKNEETRLRLFTSRCQVKNWISNI